MRLLGCAIVVLLSATPAFAGRKGAVTATLSEHAQKVGGVSIAVSGDRLIVKSGKKQVSAHTAPWVELVAFKKLIQLHGAEVTVASATKLPKRKLTLDGAIAFARKEADASGEHAESHDGVIEVTLSEGDVTVVHAIYGVRSHDRLALEVSAHDTPAEPQGDWADRILAAHNQVRADHCAPALAWSEKLAKVAQAWADHLKKDGCAFEHSTTDYGENLAAGTADSLSAEDVVSMWYEEIADYDFAHGDFSMDTGHFAQVIWKDTRKVGCGVARCGGNDLFVCNYDPPGNVDGEYAENVLPKSCKK